MCLCELNYDTLWSYTIETLHFAAIFFLWIHEWYMKILKVSKKRFQSYGKNIDEQKNEIICNYCSFCFDTWFLELFVKRRDFVERHFHICELNLLINYWEFAISQNFNILCFVGHIRHCHHILGLVLIREFHDRIHCWALFHGFHDHGHVHDWASLHVSRDRMHCWAVLRALQMQLSGVFHVIHRFGRCHELDIVVEALYVYHSRPIDVAHDDYAHHDGHDVVCAYAHHDVLGI